MTRAIAVAFALACAPARDPLRPIPLDASSDAGIGPGGACPTAGGCAPGLACWYLPAARLSLCTAQCTRGPGDCLVAGFRDGCCISPGQVNGPLPPLCMAAGAHVCPTDGGLR